MVGTGAMGAAAMVGTGAMGAMGLIKDDPEALARQDAVLRSKQEALHARAAALYDGAEAIQVNFTIKKGDDLAPKDRDFLGRRSTSDRACCRLEAASTTNRLRRKSTQSGFASNVARRCAFVRRSDTRWLCFRMVRTDQRRMES